jgi:hypothetical protein
LRLRLRLRLRLGPSLSLSLFFPHLCPMMPDGTTDRGARHRVVTRHVTDDATDGGTLDATMRIGRNRQRCSTNRKDTHHHDRPHTSSSSPVS